jgi:hypothetical protein
MRKLAIALVLFSFSAFADPRLEKALDLLDPNQRPEQPDDAALGRWTAGGKDLWVVASVYDQVVQAAVLRETNGRFTLVARSNGEEPLSSEPSLYVATVKLDLIPYRIAPKEIAFGVRVSNSYESSARASASEALHLYRLHGGALRQVFVDLTHESNWDKSDRDGTESQRVVIVGKTRRKGFYDLLVRDTKTKETTTYRWNGSEYAQ